MPIAQQRNDELAALLSADLLSVNDRNVVLSLYDAVGNSFTTTETHVMGTTRLNTAPTVFVVAGGILTIGEPGLYLMLAHATFVNSGGSGEAGAFMWLEEDPGTGTYAAVPALSMTAWLPTVAGAQQSTGVMGVVRALEGYKYRWRVARTSGSDIVAVAANGSGWDVIRLYKLG